MEAIQSSYYSRYEFFILFLTLLSIVTGCGKDDSKASTTSLTSSLGGGNQGYPAAQNYSQTSPPSTSATPATTSTSDGGPITDAGGNQGGWQGTGYSQTDLEQVLSKNLGSANGVLAGLNALLVVRDPQGASVALNRVLTALFKYSQTQNASIQQAFSKALNDLTIEVNKMKADHSPKGILKSLRTMFGILFSFILLSMVAH